MAGDKVTIDAGKGVVLDVNTPPLNGGMINGKLSLNLRAESNPAVLSSCLAESQRWLVCRRQSGHGLYRGASTH